MKLNVLVPAVLICLAAACSKPNADDASSAAEPSSEDVAPDQASAKADPNIPVEQFVALATTQDCLGLYANLAGADGKARAVVQFAGQENDKLGNLDGFARADAIKAAEGEFDAAAAPMKGKTLFTYTSTTNDDYREYNMENKAFFDSTRLTWGSSDPMGNSMGNTELALTKGDGHCVLRLVNTEAWQGQFKVPDEAQARAADAARQAGNGHVKFYLRAVTADAADNSLDWPRVNAEVVRIELVDKAGNVLALAQPSL